MKLFYKQRKKDMDLIHVCTSSRKKNQMRHVKVG